MERESTRPPRRRARRRARCGSFASYTAMNETARKGRRTWTRLPRLWRYCARGKAEAGSGHDLPLIKQRQIGKYKTRGSFSESLYSRIATAKWKYNFERRMLKRPCLKNCIFAMYAQAGKSFIESGCSVVTRERRRVMRLSICTTGLTYGRDV